MSRVKRGASLGRLKCKNASQELGLAGRAPGRRLAAPQVNTDGWPQTLMAVNAVGYVCEAAYHHADLAVTWGKPG